METNYFKLSPSLGKYTAFKVNEVGNNGFYAEINVDTENDTFSANIYRNGQLSDLGINCWTFSYHVEGSYSSFSNDFKIYATDPKKQKIEFYNTPYGRDNNSIGREEFILCSFLDLVFLYGHFENAEIANNFNLLLRSLEYNKRNPSRRYEDERQITPEVALKQARFFKEYYLKHIESNKDSYFMNIIKETVNKAVEICQEQLEKCKIED